MGKGFGKLLSTLIAFICASCLMSLAAYATDITIKDVANTDEAYSQIQWAVNQGYMGLSLGKFMPNNNVKRNEFTVILAKLNGDIKSLDNPKTSSFLDVAPKDQFFRYIETEKSYMTYTKNTKGYFFKPLTFLTREDAALSIVRVLGYDSDEAISDSMDSDVSLDSVIQDADKVSPVLQKYVALAVQNNLIEVRQDGESIYFDPKKSITRKQLAVFIYNAKQNRDLKIQDSVVIDDMQVADASSSGSSKGNKASTVDSIKIVLPKTNIEVNERIKATAGVTMTKAVVNKPGIVFSSSDINVAMVDGEGNILGIKPGTTNIIAKAGDKEARVQLRVGGNSTVKELSVSVDSPTLKVGDLIKAKVNIRMDPVDAQKPACTVSSSNPSVLFADNEGNIKAISEGNADITVSCGDKTSKVSVVVKNEFVSMMEATINGAAKTYTAYGNCELGLFGGWEFYVFGDKYSANDSFTIRIPTNVAAGDTYTLDSEQSGNSTAVEFPYEVMYTTKDNSLVNLGVRNYYGIIGDDMGITSNFTIKIDSFTGRGGYVEGTLNGYIKFNQVDSMTITNGKFKIKIAESKY